MSEEEINAKVQEMVSKIETICGTYTYFLESNGVLKINDIDKNTLIQFTAFCIDLKNLYYKEKRKNEKVKLYIQEKKKIQYKYALSQVECDEIIEILGGTVI